MFLPEITLITKQVIIGGKRAASKIAALFIYGRPAQVSGVTYKSLLIFSAS